MSAGPATESQIFQRYKDENFIAVCLDVWNGSENGVRNFKNRTGITYPIGLTASDVAQAYGVSYDYSIVIDQGGIIQYSDWGANTNAINSVIDNLLATATSVEQNSDTADRFSLAANYPNPFNPSTTLAFTLEKSQRVSLKIYDLKGRLVKTLMDGILDSGGHQYRWNAQNQSGQRVSSGVYYYVLQGENQRQSRKMVLMQ
ncbi:MAG: T9SS C-terminal target domain-containing protein [Calditrichaeota bacterium]|nr:MAG: T9SS C-terminal target domain-containing protein [Calditrichota bacterium]